MITQKYKWQMIEKTEENVEKNAEELDEICKEQIFKSINPIILKLLVKRGIDTAEKIEKFLNPTISNLNDEFLFNDMNKAIDRVIKAKENGEKITVYGDYDVDGITSIAVMYSFLLEQGFNVEYYIPSRLKEGYGMNKDAIKKIASNDTKLIITVDTGIAAIEEARLIKELGMDLIITDHHEMQEKLPDAMAIINPKCPNENYPFRSLAGVGVSFKFVCALAKKLEENSKENEENKKNENDKDNENNKNNNELIKESMCNKYLDLVTLGTVADVMELIDENRIIVKNGLEKIKNTNNVGLMCLLKLLGLKDKNNISARDVGFIIAPKLNAAGRLGDAELALKLLLEKDQEEANKIAKDLIDKNQERQVNEQRILDEAIDIINNDEKMINSKMIIVAGHDWKQGVIGIVASRLVSLYYKPVVIMSINDETRSLSGSARSIDGVNIFELISNKKDLLTKFGGHEGAAGLSLELDNFDEFKSKLIEVANENIEQDLLIPSCYIDESINVNDITFELINDLKLLEPYGAGNEKPIFKIIGIISNANIIGKNANHLKLKIKAKECDSFSTSAIDGLFFNEGEIFSEIVLNNEYEVVGEIDENEFNGVKSLQCMIKDLRNSTFYLNNIKNDILKYLNVIKDLRLDFNLEGNSIANLDTNFDDNNTNVIDLIKNNNIINLGVLENKCNLENSNISDISDNSDNQDISIANNENVLITREDVVKVYKYLLHLVKLKKNYVNIEDANFNIKDIDIYGILICLTILNELGIVSFNSKEIDNFEFSFKINENVKNKIENSKLYNKLAN